jgi:hypothetical protein
MQPKPTEKATHLAVISNRDDDRDAFTQVANRLGIEFVQITEKAQLQAHLVVHPSTLLIWALGETEQLLPGSPLHPMGIRSLLSTLASPRQVFALSDQSLSRYAEFLSETPYFHHHLFRRNELAKNTALAVYTRLISLAYHRDLEPILPHFFPDAVQGETYLKFHPKVSKDRARLVEHCTKVFAAWGVRKRLCDHVAQAVDELLMNSIFNAPCSSEGLPLRRQWARGADFSLPAGEVITMELAKGKEYCGVCVTDRFGSLQKNTFLGILAKNFRKSNYSVREMEQGAGLGLHGILETGLSIAFVCRPKVSTQVLVLFPQTSSHKRFLEGFRFISYFGDAAPELGRSQPALGWATLFI